MCLIVRIRWSMALISREIREADNFVVDPRATIESSDVFVVDQIFLDFCNPIAQLVSHVAYAILYQDTIDADNRLVACMVEAQRVRL